MSSLESASEPARSAPAGAPRPIIPPWLWAPYALYAISAMCILIGISKIILPIHNPAASAAAGAATPEQWVAQAFDKFYCILALHAYEIAILGVALLILLWRQVVDDAIALTLLVAIFLVGSTVTLDTIAPEFREPSRWFALAGIATAAAKLFSLHRFILGGIHPFMLAAVALLLLWNFLMPVLLGEALHHGMTHRQLMLPWRVGLGVTLLASLLLLGAVVPVGLGEAGSRDLGQPFLRSDGMRWIVAGIVFVGTFVHQHALTYAFNLPAWLAELTPATGVAAVVLIELMRAFGSRPQRLDIVIAMTPMAVTGWATLVLRAPGQYVDTGALPFDPTFFLAVYAAVLGLVAWRRQHRGLFSASVFCGVVAVVLAGIDPKLEFASKLHGLNWNPAAFALSLAMAVLAATRRDINLAVIAATVFAAAYTTSPLGRTIILGHGVRPLAMFVIVLAVMTQLLYAVFPKHVSRSLALALAISLALAVVDAFFPHLRSAATRLRVESLDYPIASSMLLLAFMSLVAWRTNDLRLLAPAAGPLVVAVFTMPGNKGWSWVAASFVVLFLGAVTSLKKGKRRMEARGGT